MEFLITRRPLEILMRYRHCYADLNLADELFKEVMGCETENERWQLLTLFSLVGKHSSLFYQAEDRLEKMSAVDHGNGD